MTFLRRQSSHKGWEGETSGTWSHTPNLFASAWEEGRLTDGKPPPSCWHEIATSSGRNCAGNGVPAHHSTFMSLCLRSITCEAHGAPKMTQFLTKVVTAPLTGSTWISTRIQALTGSRKHFHYPSSAQEEGLVGECWLIKSLEPMCVYMQHPKTSLRTTF